ncbi:hypothetical protein V496_10312, partial [Pseudogymnoascus sp. VKM F-4515 (FW-2607)]
GVPELDWQSHDAIELNHPSIAAIDAFVQANLDHVAPDDLTEQSLSSTDSEYGHPDQLTNEENEPHTSDDIPSLPLLSWSLQIKDCMSQENIFRTKEDNHLENRAAITDLRSLVSEEFGILRAERAATENRMNNVMAAIAEFKTFANETSVVIQMLHEGLDTVIQSRKQDK